MIWLQALWGRVWPYIAGLAGIVVGLFLVRQSGKTAGRQEARIDQLEADASAREKAREAAAEIDRLDDDGVRDRAERWVRHDGR